VLELLADASGNLYPARMQMALSLGWHIVFACFGIAFPAIVVFTEWRAHRRRDEALAALAHKWAKAMGVLFAAGAVSGTLLSFEMGILWPGLMGRSVRCSASRSCWRGSRSSWRRSSSACTCSAGTGCRRGRT
jgi:cytochrome d ubiquinol oxidase subunit I